MYIRFNKHFLLAINEYTTPKEDTPYLLFLSPKNPLKKINENIRSLLPKGNAFYMMKWNRNQIKKALSTGVGAPVESPDQSQRLHS